MTLKLRNKLIDKSKDEDSVEALCEHMHRLFAECDKLKEVNEQKEDDRRPSGLSNAGQPGQVS